MKNNERTKMKAWTLHEYGGLESMLWEDVEIPKPEIGEVLVKIHAAAANPFDNYMADGFLSKFKITLPAIFGRDGAGEIVTLGDGVTSFKVGDAVYGQADPEDDGTFAQFVVMRADRLLRKPNNLSYAQVAALPNTIYAAWNALFSKTSGMDIQSGQTVLILGAGGGIGTLAVQLAKWRGAKVIAVASTRQEALLKELGADEFIDYTKQRFEEIVGKRVDGVIDTICTEEETKSYSILKEGGIYVSLLRNPDSEVAYNTGVRAVLTYAPESYSATPEIEVVVAEGIIHPIISEILPMTEAPNALAKLKIGGVSGKIILSLE